VFNRDSPAEPPPLKHRPVFTQAQRNPLESARIASRYQEAIPAAPAAPADTVEAARLQSQLNTVNAQVKALEAALRESSGGSAPSRKAAAADPDFSVDSLRLKADLSHAQDDLERGYADLAYMLGQKGAGAADLYSYGGVDAAYNSPRGISKARARILAAKDQLERLSQPDAYLPSYYRHTKVREV